MIFLVGTIFGVYKKDVVDEKPTSEGYPIFFHSESSDILIISVISHLVLQPIISCFGVFCVLFYALC